MEGPPFSQGALGSPRESHSLVLLDPSVVNGMRLRSVFVQGKAAHASSSTGRRRLGSGIAKTIFFEAGRVVVERAGQREAPPVACLGCSAWFCSKA